MPLSMKLVSLRISIGILFRFPNLNVKRGDYIVLYTCKGEYETFVNKTGSRTHKLYWGFESNIWNNGCDEALLVKVDDFKKVKV